ncbi:MAG: FkbM family methyltransferase [Bacteroidota bacterium]
MLTRDNFINSPISIENELLAFFKKNDNLIIFDIGACEAEDSIRYSLLFPKSVVYAFEPRPDNIEKGENLIKKYKKTNITLEKIALSNKNGTAEFFLSEGEPKDLKNDENWNYGNKSSSLLAPSEQLKEHTEWLNFNNRIQVDTLRLEDYVQRKAIKQIDFIHMDVQGAELMVLDGAGSFLNRIKLIWLEVEAVELYMGQPLKNDVEEYMQNNNFINVLDTVGSTSGDQLYVNRLFFSDELIQKVKRLRKDGGILSRLKSLFKSI